LLPACNAWNTHSEINRTADSKHASSAKELLCTKRRSKKRLYAPYEYFSQESTSRTNKGAMAQRVAREEKVMEPETGSMSFMNLWKKIIPAISRLLSVMIL
jgi:hypothetical protein